MNKSAFASISRLFGQQGLDKLQKSHVAIIGLGGVGSWIAEALARSAVGELTLVDLDEVCISNINRQVQALHSTVGQSKIEVISKRLLDINPSIKLHLVHDFFDQSNHQDILKDHYAFVVDAIDGLKNKCLVVDQCLKKKIPVITIGAAAGKTDPTKIKVADLALSREDMLLMRMRKKLRRQYSFPKGKKAHFGVDCVYSEEQCLYPTTEGDVCLQKDPNIQGKLDCESGLGTASFVTGSFAFMAASHIVKKITQK